MKVLLVGATGNLGIRLVAALLTHGHSVVAFVRSSKKLESLLPASVYRQITVVQGDATDSISIKKAILESSCDAVVNTAGLAAILPWGRSELPAIFRAVLDAVREAGLDRQKPLRAWFLAGMGVLYYPGSESMLSNYLPIYLEHRQNLRLLQSLPSNTVDWSALCPGTMVPESSHFNVPTTSSRGKLIANAASPPSWKDSWIKHIPLIGMTLLSGMNMGRYETSLEQNAEFIASDLETYESQWSGTTVGIIDGSK
ncbi:NAD(P)-binding protein [Cucurbitaria berberidis CBS 394.84]|uniref:NAD(P)-binding protein n=1 Tax=Cucurbitaria berberidis CBS 394.84 TaxID=1168544 RepID=A0A9P4GSP4_9PLEO|nr:NAD(P)-binding protein [Cucurbitaria berberidis CBS 394.84]KAF1852048.1 NAD(P)-binding protein [Cucurbitaria berberidis CBS 394.84]